MHVTKNVEYGKEMYTVELLMWRHAEAEDNYDDFNRHLTKKGLQQAEKMGKWVRKHYPNEYTLWVSEARRTQETASFLKHKMIIKPELNPSISASIVLNEVLNNILSKNLLLVGHQPWIGELTAYLVCNNHHVANHKPRLTYWPFKKSSIWWLEIKKDDEFQFYTKVKATLSPNFLD